MGTGWVLLRKFTLIFLLWGLSAGASVVTESLALRVVEAGESLRKTHSVAITQSAALRALCPEDLVEVVNLVLDGAESGKLATHSVEKADALSGLEIYLESLGAARGKLTKRLDLLMAVQRSTEDQEKW